ncbi:Orn/Lys/Arg decarboxylase, C-terminal domain [Musa troglodytarum]|uniref:Orn/Lys/Arg decarboxylase, C-terminal domain n=1 Tax=Musa troglodytarum TaxID=320322 RepID=A0A9E7IE58_9LILI|nr:Orn/Lys/Arg decarboxylase, C-terminal domain [Musa troglodytarum]
MYKPCIAKSKGRHRKVGSGIGGGGEQTTKSMDTRAHQTKKQATAESTEDDSYGGVAPCATNAPFVSALMVFAEREPACFCFPGHNGGKAASAMLTRLSGPDVFTYDSTPLPWLGNLFSSKGPLTDAQELAAEVFGSSETWFLVGGSNCGVMASIMATCSPGDFLVLPRNAHVSATHAMVLSGAIPKYITPEYSSLWDVAGGVTPSQVETSIEELKEAGKRAAAVLITATTYQGICCKIDEITKLCHSHGVPVIADEAHGPHFQFHPRLPKTALEQGADLVVQSTHKVLSSLSQSSMLHMSGNRADKERMHRCLEALQSTSSS